MLSFIRRQISATNLMVVAALIFAMAGGAYAAGSGGKHHHGHYAQGAKHKGKKGKSVGERGPRGKQGPAGNEGPAGKDGATGPAGPTGPAGKDGVNGKDGANGSSVEATALEGAKEPAGEPCAGQGGSMFSSVSGTTYACNGKEGPSGLLATLTGVWGEASTAQGLHAVAISYLKPISPPPTAVYETKNAEYGLVYNTENGELIELIVEEPAKLEPYCGKGTAANPQAEPGYLCIFTATEENGQADLSPLVGKQKQYLWASPDPEAGTLVPISTEGSENAPAYVTGTWAVTERSTP